jgi:hypothetical protein
MKLTIGNATADDALIASGFAGLKFPVFIRFTNRLAMRLVVAEVPGLALDHPAKVGGNATLELRVTSKDQLQRLTVSVKQLAMLRGKSEALILEWVDESPVMVDLSVTVSEEDHVAVESSASTGKVTSRARTAK